MSKLKSEFKKDEHKTQLMKVFYNKILDDDTKNYEFIGVYEYKNYQIYFDHIPDKKKIIKHITIKNIKGNEIKQKDLKLIANHFIGDRYIIQYGLFNNNTVGIWEEKGTISNS